MSDKAIGLYDKFTVTRTDGTSKDGRKHHGCKYFVLDLTHDPFALPAIVAYRNACQAEYPKLAADLGDRIFQMENRQQPSPSSSAPPDTKGGVEHAINLVLNQCSGKPDRAGIEPYIFHSLRVMLAVDSSIRVAAMLHDVVEDFPVSLATLREAGFSPEVVATVDALTRRDGEKYFDYIDRCCRHRLARFVKRADLRDNMDRLRTLPADEAESMWKRYDKAWNIVLDYEAGLVREESNV